jgi:hypothetical protein
VSVASAIVVFRGKLLRRKIHLTVSVELVAGAQQLAAIRLNNRAAIALSARLTFNPRGTLRLRTEHSRLGLGYS